MKTHKLLSNFILLSLALTSVSSFAENCSGGSCTGGGNRLNGKLIYKYARVWEKLPDYEEAEERLKKIDELLPEFGQNLHQITKSSVTSADSVQWFLIPEKFKELSTNITGLTFSTDQAAAQKNRRIFVSQEDIASDSKEERAELYLNEILEMAHPKKDPEAVGKLMQYLDEHKYHPPQQDFQKAVANLGFGQYATGKEVALERRNGEAYRQIAHQMAKPIFEDMLNKISVACAKDLSPGGRLDGVRFALSSADFYPEIKADVRDSDGNVPRDKFAAYKQQRIAKDQLFKNERFLSLVAAAYPQAPLQLPITFFNQENQAIEKKYEEKYNLYTDQQRLERSCDDIQALRQRAESTVKTEGASNGESDDAQ